MAEAPKSILVADDEPAIARLIASMLPPEFQVEIAAGEDDGLARISSRCPDLLIADVSMKGRAALVQALEDCGPSSAILYISGFGEGDIRELGVQVSETNFLVKPFTLGDLVAAVKRALDAPPRPARTRTSRPHAG